MVCVPACADLKSLGGQRANFEAAGTESIAKLTPIFQQARRSRGDLALGRWGLVGSRHCWRVQYRHDVGAQGVPVGVADLSALEPKISVARRLGDARHSHPSHMVSKIRHRPRARTLALEADRKSTRLNSSHLG